MARNKYNAGDTVEIIDDVDSYGRFKLGQRGVVRQVVERVTRYCGACYTDYEYAIDGISGEVAERRLKRVDERRVVQRYEPHVDRSPWNRYRDE